VAKTINRLTALKVSKIKKPGWYPDGLGLYLQVSKTGSKSWVYRYEISGKEHRHGLGSIHDTSLEEARITAETCRSLRREGINPIEHKKRLEVAKKLQKTKNITFKECALAYIEAHKDSWKNRKHESQWRNTLETYAYPVIGDLPVQDVDVGLILSILEPLWKTKTETATRVRQRIENILDWATVREYRQGENPARWRGHLDKTLPKRSKVQKVQHFKAMKYSDVPAYFQILRETDSQSARALAFIILTATRSSEARGAKWDEIDLKAKVWTLPPERMKAGRQHRIPLSPEALKILKEVKPLAQDGFVFPGMRKGRPISEGTVYKLLKDEHKGATVHGFRSSFRDWCAEMTSYPREVAEAALAHVLTDKTEAAYQRGDIFDKRRRLMNAWAEYCLKSGRRGNVVPLKEGVK
jgi:integrase